SPPQSLTGRVFFAGPPPPRHPLHLDHEPVTPGDSRPDLLSERRIVNPQNHGIQNAVVFVKSGLAGPMPPPPAEPVVLKIQGWRYEPHVAVVRVGQKLVVWNFDRSPCAPHTQSRYRAGETVERVTQPGQQTTFQFFHTEAGFRLLDDIHAFLDATISVVDNPYHAVTDSDGTFAIPNLPPGNYTLTAWSDWYGELNQTIVWDSTKPLTLNFSFDANAPHVPLKP
ncbi:MAG TPA: carboxypeptidase-like regulatory domain-containing protein, partial [Planctomycetota bacterium]|nr:carboxypeptidase-like regulatory domain-containing protein [Planctomycetota bacterium]